MNETISVNIGDLLLSLTDIIDLSNTHIAKYHERTAFIAAEISRNCDDFEEFYDDTFTAALLHDIGDISSNPTVLGYKDFNNPDFHCIKASLLLEQIPWFDNVSRIVRFHHKSWREWKKNGEYIENTIVCASQIINLASYVVRLIEDKTHILLQKDEIIETVKSLRNTIIHEKIIDVFLKISIREEFWLDIVSNKMYYLLKESGLYKNVEAGLDGLIMISNLFKSIIDFKSPYTATHSSGVSACAGKMSQLYGFSDHKVQLVEIAGNLHDIGKVIIPNNILEKPGDLSKNEFEIIKSHTYYTYQILKRISGLKDIIGWASNHHEKLNGSGYPFHYKEGELDEGSRIMIISDIFTAASEDRPYRKALEKNQIYTVIVNSIKENSVDVNMAELLLDNYETVNSYVREKQHEASDFYQNRFLKIIEESL